MARTAKFSDAGGSTRATPRNMASSRPSDSNDADSTLSPSPTPSTSFSSDKENRRSTSAAATSRGKGKARTMGPPDTLTSNGPTPRAGQKRKLADRAEQPNLTQNLHQQRLEEVEDKDLYDPEQDIEQRRALKKDYRDLSRELTDSRAEYLAPSSDGLMKTINRSNELFSTVKQTSDATLDSRLLVSTADLSMKRTTQLNLGDNATGIDIDDFVSKCITFMRNGPAEGHGSTQARRRRGGRLNDDSDEEGNAPEGYDEGDAFNWEYLGRQACCPYSVRPPVPGFLLGPLSVQRRVRRATQRTQRLGRRNDGVAVRPEELQAKDLEKSESSNLTVICENIRTLLRKTINERIEAMKQEDTDNSTEAEFNALMVKHGISADEGVPLFEFVMNPRSFGQTVENLFYVSFLIKDGYAGIGNDANLMPTLRWQDVQKRKGEQSSGSQKNQAVFHLDFETWEDIVQCFDIKRSIIPHRKPDPKANMSGSGWYA